MTRPEVVLWLSLRGRKLNGLHFRRQHPIGPYVLDFYCHAARLCLEVDGAGHAADDRSLRDQVRDAWLEKAGIRTLRLRAGLILEDMGAALRMIEGAVRRGEVPLSRSATAPPAGEH